MSEKEFTIEQIESRVDSLYEYLDERTLRIKKSDMTADKLQEMYQKFDDLFDKIGKLKTLSKTSIVQPLETVRNAVIVSEVQKGNVNPDELYRLSNMEFGYRKRSESKQEQVSDDSDTSFIPNSFSQDSFGTEQNRPF